MRQEAEFVLVGETGLSGGAVMHRLTLFALDDGRLIVKTPDVALTGYALPAAGDRIYWPAMGPPSETRVGCHVYPRLPFGLRETLARHEDRPLNAREVETLRTILHESAPAAAAGLRVRITE